MYATQQFLHAVPDVKDDDHIVNDREQNAVNMPLAAMQEMSYLERKVAFSGVNAHRSGISERESIASSSCSAHRIPVSPAPSASRRCRIESKSRFARAVCLTLKATLRAQ